MENFGCLNSSLSLIYFYFAISLQKKKKNYGMCTLTVKPPLPHIRTRVLLAEPPLSPLGCTYSMDNLRQTQEKEWVFCAHIIQTVVL